MINRFVLLFLSVFILTCASSNVPNNHNILYGRALEKNLKNFKFQKVDSARTQNIVIIIAPRAFRDEEFQIPYEYLTSLGYKIKLASRDTILATGMLGLAVRPQLSIEDIDTLAYDGLILVGGTGSAIYWEDLKVHALVRHFAKTSGKFVAAICLAPITLARAKVLEGHTATVYENNFTRAEFSKYKVIYKKTDCVLCDNIITANGPEASTKFAQTIAYYLQNRQRY
ncbi:MAG: DJ-1/PfpI family protein, partial [candidate division WOR-3 bacterium]|nr:DJ-1/PfpI family protein [candidate division WOR-3 bacterium]